MPFLRGGELGLLPAEAALRLSDGHSFACAHPDQVGLAGGSYGNRPHTELRDSAHWVRLVRVSRLSTAYRAPPTSASDPVKGLQNWRLQNFQLRERTTGPGAQFAASQKRISRTAMGSSWFRSSQRRKLDAQPAISSMIARALKI